MFKLKDMLNEFFGREDSEESYPFNDLFKLNFLDKTCSKNAKGLSITL